MTVTTEALLAFLEMDGPDIDAALADADTKELADLYAELKAIELLAKNVKARVKGLLVEMLDEPVVTANGLKLRPETDTTTAYKDKAALEKSLFKLGVQQARADAEPMVDPETGELRKPTWVGLSPDFVRKYFTPATGRLKSLEEAGFLSLATVTEKPIIKEG